MFKEFKEFALKGSIIELALAFVLGAAFAALVTSFVDNILMAIVGILFGEPNFDNALVLTINDSQIRFGAFLTVLVSFVLIAWALFVFVVKPYKAYEEANPEPEAPAEDPEDIQLLRQIRDSLSK